LVKVQGNRIALLLACMSICASTTAQWSIGEPGERHAPAHLERFIYVVLADPVPGREVEFNEWYQNTHMGDLLQLPGWTGAQRFRLVTEVVPRPTTAGYDRGYLIVWDQVGNDALQLRHEAAAAIAGGKSRKSAAFDYTPGVARSASYQALSARLERTGGARPFTPADDDNQHPRRNRYMFMEYVDPPPGAAGFEASLDHRLRELLALPGWLAGQTFRLVANPATTAPLPKYLTMVEIEADSAQSADDLLRGAAANGRLSRLGVDDVTRQASYWQPISPYVTRADFQR
jgi:hypothetical protein